VKNFIKISLLLICLVCLGFITACASNNTAQRNENPLPEKAKTNNPKAANINMQLGIGYLQQEQIDRAKQKLLLAKEQNPTSPLVWDSLAYFYATTGDANKANQYYQKAISIAPKDGETLNNYGVFLCGQGKYQQALTYFYKAVEDPAYVTTGQAYENAGLCAQQIPNLKKAKSLFLKALKNDPTLSGANLELAKMMFDKKQYSKSSYYLKRYKMNAKPNAESLWLEIRLANIAGDQDTVASDALLLKSKYGLSKEYQQFKKSGINL